MAYVIGGLFTCFFFLGESAATWNWSAALRLPGSGYETGPAFETPPADPPAVESLDLSHEDWQDYQDYRQWKAYQGQVVKMEQAKGKLSYENSKNSRYDVR